MSLSLAEQSFVHRLMISKTMTSQDAISNYNKCDTAAANVRRRRPKQLRDLQELDAKLVKINNALREFGTTVRTIYSPWEKKHFVSLINTIDDDAARVANLFSKNETTVFFTIVDHLIELGGSMNPHYAIKIGQDEGLSGLNAQRLLQKMQRLNWFRVQVAPTVEEPTLIFGARALLELPDVNEMAKKVGASNARLLHNGATQSDGLQLRKREDERVEEDHAEEVVESRRRRPLPRQSDPMDDVEHDEDEEIRPQRKRTRSQRSRTSSSQARQSQMREV